MYSGRKFDYTPYTKIANELIIQLYWHKHSLRCYMVALYTPCRVGVSYGCESDYTLLIGPAGIFSKNDII